LGANIPTAFAPHFLPVDEQAKPEAVIQLGAFRTIYETIPNAAGEDLPQLVRASR